MVLHNIFTESLQKVVFTCQVTSLKKYMNCIDLRWIYEYSEKCADWCNEDLYLPKDTRKMFSFFDFTPDNAVESWEVLKPAVEIFHGNAENYYSNVYGLFQENLLPKKFGGDITLTNILLPEVGNHILMQRKFVMIIQ